MPVPEYVVVAMVVAFDESFMSFNYLKYEVNYPIVNSDCVQPLFDPDRRTAAIFPTEKSAFEAMSLIASAIMNGNQHTHAFTGLGSKLLGLGMTVPPSKRIELSVQKIELSKLASTFLIAEEDEGKKTLSINRYVTGE